MSIREYKIENLNCASCSAKIEKEIGNLAKVSEVNLDFMNKRLIVQFIDDMEDGLDEINKIANAIEPGVYFYSNEEDHHQHGSGKYAYVIYGGLILWLFSLLLPIPPLYKSLLAITAYFMVAGRVLLQAGREVFSKQLLAEHFLMGIASLGALYLGEYSEAIAVMGLYELGEYLESRALAGSRRSVQKLLNLKPEKAHRKRGDNEIEDVKLAQLEIGDKILVYAGERIPVDGVIIHGESTLDTSSITGEAEPVWVQRGEQVYAGCMNNTGLLEIKVEKNEAESMVSRIMKLIESAGAKKSRQERFITRFARYYTPAVVAMALAVYLVPLAMGLPAAVWFKRALVFLIVSCPCALVISIPLSYYIGIGIAARRGIIFKGSNYLDRLRKTTTLVFDKTGTLTTGDLKLEGLKTMPDASKEKLQEALYFAEYTSNHPYAIAVKNAFKYPFDAAKVISFTEIPGKGIIIDYDGLNITAGSEGFFKELGYLDLIDAKNFSAVHIAIDGVYQGVALFSDEIKPAMHESLHTLKKFGVKRQLMLSGDRHAKAEQVAKDLRLDGFYAQLLPHEKLEKIEEMLAEDETVVFVGDGLNDAPVLARADIGIAMGAIGAQASVESADLVLLNDSPQQLVHAYRLSRLTNRIVWQNISLALGIKILVMIMGLSGISGLWEAIIADVGVSLLVILNSLKMLKIKERA